MAKISNIIRYLDIALATYDIKIKPILQLYRISRQNRYKGDITDI